MAKYWPKILLFSLTLYCLIGWLGQVTPFVGRLSLADTEDSLVAPQKQTSRMAQGSLPKFLGSFVKLYQNDANSKKRGPWATFLTRIPNSGKLLTNII